MTKVDPERVAIVAPNWLGDAVMALAAMADVREEFPRAALAVAARPSIAPLFQTVRGVDEVVTLTSTGGIRTASVNADAEALRAGRFDLAILLPNSFATAWTVARAGIPERWGYRADWRTRWLTRHVPRPRGGHQISYYRDLVRAFGIGPAVDPLPIVVPGERQEAARERLRSLGWDGASRLVGIAPGAAYGTAKQWPPEYFAMLIDDLRARDRATGVLLGTAADAAVGRSITVRSGRSSDRPTRPTRPIRPTGPIRPIRPTRPTGPTLFNLIGHTDLPALVAVLSICDAFVSNDSGAMHLAAALGVPVTAIFGPTNERETAPRGSVVCGADAGLKPRATARIIVHEVWCRPCMLRECPVDHRCMRAVEPARVAEACRAAFTA